jgi:hypothetical protein
MDRRVADDAVALAEGVVEAGQLFAARGGLDPEAELANLDGLLVQVHAVEVVLENLPVEIKEGALAAQFLQPGVGESDVQAGVAFVNGPEQAAEVQPDGAALSLIRIERLGSRLELRKAMLRDVLHGYACFAAEQSYVPEHIRQPIFEFDGLILRQRQFA